MKKHSVLRPSTLRHRKGMTALEVAIAIGAGLLFLAAAAYGVIRFLDTQRYGTFTRQAGDQMLSILGQIYGQQGTLTALTTAGGAALLQTMGMKPTTPWGGSWTVSTSGAATTVGITFPLGGNQIATQGSSTAGNLSSLYPGISCSLTSPNIACSYNMQY